MKQVHKTLLALTLPLFIAACSSVPKDNGEGSTSGNQSPNVSILTTSGSPIAATMVVSPVAQFKLKVSDVDGTVTAVSWKVTKSGSTVASGSFQGSEIQSSMDLTLPTLAAGSYVLSVTVTDNAGASSTASVNFVVDAAAPTLTSVTVNGNAVADGASISGQVGSTYTLVAKASDNSGAALIQVYQGSTLIASGSNTVSVDLSSSSATTSNYTVVVSDAVGNSATQTFSINYVSSNSQVAPSPRLVINNTGSQPYSNILSVTASAGLSAGVGIKQLILEVTDSKGIVDTTTYTSNQETATFNIDTTKYPDGNLSMRVVAVDANDLRGSSAVTAVQIANAVSPTITIVTPTSGSTVTGPTTITAQVRQNNTAFSFKDNQALIEVVDSRGQVITTQTATFSPVNTGLWQASTSIDFNATQYLNAGYTIRASTGVTLSGESTVRTVTATSQVTNQSKPVQPPALTILSPAFFNPTDLNNPDPNIRPTLNRNSAVAVQVSDSDNIKQVQLEFVCDPAEVNSSIGQACNTTAYSYHLPIGAAGLFYKVFNTGVLMDGQPFVPNGFYVMRITAVDDTGLTNIKEMRVNVDRSKIGIPNLTYNRVDIYDDGVSKLRPTAAEWGISPSFSDTNAWDRSLFDFSTHTLRVLSFVYDSNEKGIARENPSRVGIATAMAPGGLIRNGFAFNQGGIYATSFLVEDLNTGITQWYDGQDVYVASR